MTVVNQGVPDVQAELDFSEVEIGENANASGERAVAVGSEAGALADLSVALGADSVMDLASTVGFGDRDVQIADGRTVIYPADRGSQTVASLPLDGAPQGESHNMVFTVGGESVIELRAKADGAGGVEDLTVYAPGDLSVEGDAREIDETVTGQITVEDPAGEVQFTVDATQDPPLIDFAGNTQSSVARINATGGELLVEGDLTISGELTEGEAL